MNLINIVNGKEISNGQGLLGIQDFNTGEVIGTMPDLSDDQINLALESAKREYNQWRELSIKKRLEVFSKAGDILLGDTSLDELVARAGLCSQKVAREDRETVAHWLKKSGSYMSHYLGGKDIEQENITGIGSSTPLNSGLISSNRPIPPSIEK